MSSIFVKFAFCVFILPSVLNDQETKSTTINIAQRIKNEIVGIEDLLNKIEKPTEPEKKIELALLKGELLGFYKGMAKRVIMAEEKDREIGGLQKDLVQSKLDLLKNLCNDARKGRTIEETWLNILHESKSPHSMLLRYRIKSCGLTYEIFAQYAQAFEQDINFLRHPEHLKKLSKREVEEVTKTLQVEESLTSVVEVILIPFPKTTTIKFDKAGPFATFECVKFLKVPGGVSIDALKDAICTLNDDEKKLIQTKFVTKDDKTKKITGEVAMCFRDHDTAFKFWFNSDPLMIQVSDKQTVRIGFRPILDSTKESLFPSPSNE